MAKTGLVYDDIYLNHDTGPHHPETVPSISLKKTRQCSTLVFTRIRLLATPVQGGLKKQEAGKEKDTPKTSPCPPVREIKRI